MKKKKIIIIGGGASGLMAAIAAAEEGASVTILEQNERPGRKILATGNGRCNLTNAGLDPDAYHGETPAFCHGALAFLPVQDTMRFFTKLGIYIREGRDKLLCLLSADYRPQKDLRINRG